MLWTTRTTNGRWWNGNQLNAAPSSLAVSWRRGPKSPQQLPPPGVRTLSAAHRQPPDRRPAGSRASPRISSGEGGAARSVHHVRQRIDAPVVAVGVAPEEVASLHPDIAAFEDTAQDRAAPALVYGPG